MRLNQPIGFLASCLQARTASVSIRGIRLLTLAASREYATQTSLGGTSTTKPRKAVTVVNDDGRVKWGDLSLGEKAARTTQQTFNLGIILAGLVLTGGVGYVLYSEVFALDSKINHFNRAANQVRSDRRVVDLLGPRKEIRAFGEPSWNKWSRNRRIASETRKDKNGTEHILMHFNVEGPLNSGVVNLHLVKTPESPEFKYKYLVLEVKGHPPLYLENDKPVEKDKKSLSVFGIKWR